MRTATIHDLQTRLPTILAWLEAGEEVVVKPKAMQTATPPPSEPKVDWTKSAAFRDRTGERVLNLEETVELYESIKGDY